MFLTVYIEARMFLFFSELRLGNVLKMFLFIWKSEPGCSYKQKNQCIAGLWTLATALRPWPLVMDYDV